MMTRDEAIKSLYCRGDMTKEDIVNKIYDAHEAECKAKDERIAKLEAKKAKQDKGYDGR